MLHPVDEVAPTPVHTCNALVLTVGLPRSGKTTWARSMSLPIVCPDEIRRVLHGEAFRPETEPMVWAIAKVMVRALFRAGNRVVIVDACSISPKRRAEWRDPEWVTCYHAVETAPEVCIEWALRDDRPELVEVIQRMHLERDPVDLDALPHIRTHLDLLPATRWRTGECAGCRRETEERHARARSGER